MSRMKSKNGYVMMMAAALLLCTSGAMGQDASLSSVETEMTPGELPGHHRGERSRDEKPEAATKGEPVLAIDDAPAAEENIEGFRAGGKPWGQWGRATGDWGGFRTGLEDKGVTFAASLILDFSTVFEGGVNERGSSRRLFDANVTFDFEKLFGWKGGSVFADFYHYGGRLENDAGDIAVYDNIATGIHRDQLAQLWFQQKLFDDVLRVKVGKIEANAEFAYINPATTFLNSAAIWSPNMVGFTTYPDPALGVVAFVYPCEFFYAGFGFFDGASLDGFRTGSRAGFDTFLDNDKTDDNYYIGEAGFTWKNFGKVGGRFGKGRVAGGVWHHSHEFTGFDSNVEDGTTGFYVLGEQLLWKRDDDENSDKGLWLFARANFADDNVAAVGTHAGVGVTLRGTFAGRENDEIGFMYSHSDMSDESSSFDGDENAYEVFYKLQLFGSVALTPDFQYITNPSGNSTLEDAMVGSLRVSITF